METARGRCLWVVCLALSLGARADDVDRGAALYTGRAVLLTQEGKPGRDCQECHRPSGLGTFEGGLAIPPITGPSLFRPYDRDVAHFFAPSSRYRVRPAYGLAGLATMLRTGVAPDGVVLHPAMPRYVISDADVSALAAHLRGLSNALPGGIDGQAVHIATITAPGADPARRAAMVETLQRFVAVKNAQSRNEVRRAETSLRTGEMASYRKYRTWVLQHWALQGPADTWAAQLDDWQTRQPVYAVVGGLGSVQWTPVYEFCERQRLPCLLPLVDAAPPVPDGLYTLHFHAGLGADADLAARALLAQGHTGFAFVPGATDRLAQALVADQFRRAGLRVSPANGEAHMALVSLLAPAAHAAWLQAARPTATVVWLPGTHALGSADLDATVPLTTHGVVVTPMRTGADLDQQLRRARSWLQANALGHLPADVAASALLAAGVLGESLAHADFEFSQSYLLELLEHGLENMLPLSPFPRLALGPGQRLASKGSWVGDVGEGRISWHWQPVPR